MNFATEIEKLRTSEELWKIFSEIQKCNQTIALSSGPIVTACQSLNECNRHFFIDENTHVYCQTPISLKRYDRPQNSTPSKPAYICFNEKSLQLLDSDPKNINTFLTKQNWLIAEGFQNIISPKKQIAIAGLCNTIFEDETISEFVFNNLTEHGQNAYTKIYEEYKKYSFTAPFIVYKNITIPEAKELLGYEYATLNLAAYTYGISISYSIYDNVTKQYTKKNLQVSKSYSYINQRINSPVEEEKGKIDLEKTNQIKENLFDMYILNSIAPKINSTLAQMGAEVNANFAEYTKFSKEVEEILQPYLVLLKI